MSMFGGILDKALEDSMVYGIKSNCTITDLVIEGSLSQGGIESLLAVYLAMTNIEKLSLKYTVAHGADWSGLSSFVSFIVWTFQTARLEKHWPYPLLFCWNRQSHWKCFS